ncbi:GNAT family N-acetyltransferase [Leuconostocaceae bacterium ESL0958]|nr:GNAT family N-acetyltransferase [Leuconostocaceae bacterium ESL0958]
MTAVQAYEYWLAPLDLQQAAMVENLLTALGQETDTFAVDAARDHSTALSFPKDGPYFQDDVVPAAEWPEKTWLIWAQAAPNATGAAAFPVGIASLAGAEVGIAILQAHQNQGLGRLALTALIDWAKEVGYQKLWLDVDQDNAPARHLYDRLGFVKQAIDLPAVTLPSGRQCQLERRERALR